MNNHILKQKITYFLNYLSEECGIENLEEYSILFESFIEACVEELLENKDVVHK